MSDANILLGYIEEPKPQHQADPQFFRRANDLVLAGLPPDDAWPPLYRSLFSVTGDDSMHGSVRGRRLIHFAGHFNYLVGHLGAWLDKFEPLLQRLYWIDAEVLVMNAWSGPPLRLRYNITRDTAVGYTTTTPSPPQSWELRAYRIGDEEMFGGDLAEFLGAGRLLRTRDEDSGGTAVA